MAVKRVVANIKTEQVDAGAGFYGDILDMRPVMDQGWIATFAADGVAAPQISIASQGGSGAEVPDLSIEVDDLEKVYQRVIAAGLPVEYGPASEPWGVRRFYTRDPFGRLVNILVHEHPIE